MFCDDLIVLQRWKVSCFKQEELFPENSKPDFVERFVPEELIKPEYENPNPVKRDWRSSFREVYFPFFMRFCLIVA